MLRAFQFRLYPNATQRSALEFVLRDDAETYNAALQERRDPLPQGVLRTKPCLPTCYFNDSQVFYSANPPGIPT
jgi:hypothetical protein